MRRAALALLVALGCHGADRYTGVGDVVAIDPAAGRVTISHDEIPGLMGAMTMAFAARSPEVVAGLSVGTRVRFELERRGNALVLTRAVPAGVAGGPRPGVHDHTPHHGGVVAMVGMRHLEAAASPDGRVRVYLTDVWRRPLPLSGATGTVTLDLPTGTQELPLAERDGALEATGPSLRGRDVAVAVSVTQGGEPAESHFLLPLAADTTGAADVPLDGCVPPASGVADGRAPRCTLSFAHPVTFVATSADGTRALVAVLGAGVSAWRMPGGEFEAGFAPPPPIELPPGATPHADAVNAIAVSPDGAEATVAFENRLVVYRPASGGFLRELPHLAGAIRSVAWSPDGGQLLVTVFYDHVAHLLDPKDGRELRRVPVEREGAGVAFAPTGRLAAVGSELGPITLFERDGGAARVLQASEKPIEALAFAGDRLVSAGDDGRARTWDVTTGGFVAYPEAGGALFRLAVAPGGRLVAIAGLDRTIRLHDVATGAVVETLRWHEAAVWGLAWAGRTLVSADGAGRTGLWDLSDRVE